MYSHVICELEKSAFSLLYIYENDDFLLFIVTP